MYIYTVYHFILHEASSARLEKLKKNPVSYCLSVKKQARGVSTALSEASKVQQAPMCWNPQSTMQGIECTMYIYIYIYTSVKPNLTVDIIPTATFSSPSHSLLASIKMKEGTRYEKPSSVNTRFNKEGQTLATLRHRPQVSLTCNVFVPVTMLLEVFVWSKFLLQQPSPVHNLKIIITDWVYHGWTSSSLSHTQTHTKPFNINATIWAYCYYKLIIVLVSGEVSQFCSNDQHQSVNGLSPTSSFKETSTAQKHVRKETGYWAQLKAPLPTITIPKAFNLTTIWYCVDQQSAWCYQSDSSIQINVIYPILIAAHLSHDHKMCSIGWDQVKVWILEGSKSHSKCIWTLFLLLSERNLDPEIRL